MKWPRNIEIWAQQHPGHLINKLRRIWVNRHELHIHMLEKKAEGKTFDEAVKILFAQWVAEQRLR